MKSTQSRQRSPALQLFACRERSQLVSDLRAWFPGFLAGDDPDVDMVLAYVRRVTDELREALAKNDDANTRALLLTLDKILSHVWECDGGPMHLDTEAIVPLLARAAARQQHAKLVAEVFYVVGELSALPESLKAAFNALAAALNVEAGATNPDRDSLLLIVNSLGQMWAQGHLGPSRFACGRKVCPAPALALLRIRALRELVACTRCAPTAVAGCLAARALQDTQTHMRTHSHTHHTSDFRLL